MKKYSILIFSIALFLGCAINSSKERKQEDTNNFVRNAHSMAYHIKESKVYSFGGASEKEVVSDLWVLEGTNWQKIITKVEPESRTFASLVYDKKNNRLILFGGSKVLFGKEVTPQNLLNDTWVFKNNDWTRLVTNTSPKPRAEAAIVYDEARETIILFGGYYIKDGEYIKLGDTWEFRNNDWHLVSNTGPSKRNGASMAYDSRNETVILFGGSTIDKQYGENKGETWKWDGKTWSKLDIEQPAGVFNSSMAYNKDRGELIRFGGWNGKSRINETWSFHNNKWNKLDSENSPTPRNHSDMVYDAKNKRMVLFGGHDGDNVFGGVWEYTNLEWKKISKTKPIKRVKNGH